MIKYKFKSGPLRRGNKFAEITCFYAPPQKVAGYYVIPSELLSVYPSVRPPVLQQLIIRVRSITLIPFEIISRNLAQI